MTTEVELKNLIATVEEMARGRADQMNAIAGLLGIVTGVLIEKQLTTGDAMIAAIERISMQGSPHQREMLAIAQSALSPRPRQ